MRTSIGTGVGGSVLVTKRWSSFHHWRTRILFHSSSHRGAISVCRSARRNQGRGVAHTLGLFLLSCEIGFFSFQSLRAAVSTASRHRCCGSGNGSGFCCFAASAAAAGGLPPVVFCSTTQRRQRNFMFFEARGDVQQQLLQIPRSQSLVHGFSPEAGSFSRSQSRDSNGRMYRRME